MEYKIVNSISAKDYAFIRNELGWNVIKEEQASRTLANPIVNVSVFDGNKWLVELLEIIF